MDNICGWIKMHLAMLERVGVYLGVFLECMREKREGERLMMCVIRVYCARLGRIGMYLCPRNRWEKGRKG